LILSGCASQTQLASHVVKSIPIPGKSETPQRRSRGYFKVGSPYKIRGQLYRPKETYDYSKTGIASWYGPNFHGKQTANGEIFDQNDLTAAHKTLQIPSLVRVTNLENGRSIVLRVNDRGPFSKGRLIDVSKRGAELLGFKHKGTAKVRVEVLPEESRQIAQRARNGFDTRGTEIAINERPVDYATEAPRQETVAQQDTPNVNNFGVPVASNKEIFIQAASFGEHDNAIQFARKISDIESTTVETVVLRGQEFHRVRLGPLKDRAQAEAVSQRIADRGYDGAQIVVD